MHTATHGKTRFHFNSDLSGELVIQQIPMKDQSAVEIVRQISIPAQDVIAFALARLAEQREATAEDEEDTDLDRRLAELKTSERPPRDWLEPKHVHEMVNDAHIVLRRSEDYVPPTGDLACHVLALASENKRMRSDLRDLRDVVRAQAELKASPQAETRDVLEVMGRMTSIHENVWAHLTPRQREVLQLLAEGKSHKEIASILNISVKTAEYHKYTILGTLGLKTNAELVQYAIRHGIIAV